MVRHQVVVSVPGRVDVVAAGVELDEADPALNQPPRQPALPAEDLAPLVINSVERLRLRTLLAEVSRLRREALHLESELVAGNAGRQVGVVPPERLVLAVVRAERVEHLPLHPLRDVRRA